VNSDTNCLGDPADVATLTATGASTYVWSPATGLSATTGTTVTATPTQITVYTIIGTTVNGCLDTTTATVTTVPDFTVTVNSDSICSGQSVLLTANGAATYVWSPATGLSATTGTEVVASPTLTTVYTVTGTISGCSETATSTVVVLPQPTASIFASPNPASTIEPTVFIQTASSNNSNSKNWYLDDSLISQLQSFAYTFPGEPGSYVIELIVTNALGCSDTGFVTIVIQEDIIFYVPNAFTPNDDDFNNIFIPIITSGIDTKNYAFAIFNRWGELVFETTEFGVGWDGTYKGAKCQDGTYTWSLKFKSKYNDGIFEHTGHVNLTR
jgi:trimeric autotransporter adhesin